METMAARSMGDQGSRKEEAEVLKQAVFSNDRKYRYLLWRVWDERKPVCMFICLNPSTADENVDDPTLKKCMGFAHRWGHGGVCIGNLFAYRATDPQEMRRQEDPVGPENDRYLQWAAAHSLFVVAAWGNHGVHLRRGMQVRKMMPELWAMGLTLTCEPRHPLYVPYGAGLAPLDTEAPEDPGKVNMETDPDFVKARGLIAACEKQIAIQGEGAEISCLMNWKLDGRKERPFSRMGGPVGRIVGSRKEGVYVLFPAKELKECVEESLKAAEELVMKVQADMRSLWIKEGRC